MRCQPIDHGPHNEAQQDEEPEQHDAGGDKVGAHPFLAGLLDGQGHWFRLRVNAGPEPDAEHGEGEEGDGADAGAEVRGRLY
ncbi:hypothetical protein [Paenarthrobacter sp. C1]|uniref:hypothetical protein n=1 Tax=Paenarthrobacter sp. C1 TaxID=3400220 RepID=UPI003BF49393